MEPVFYVDLFVLYNFLVDALLLWAVASLAGRPIRISRLAGSAFLGGVAALPPYAAEWPASPTVGYAVVLAFLLVSVAFSVRSVQVLVRLTALFWLVSLLYGGVLTFFASWEGRDAGGGLSAAPTSHASWGALLLGYVLMFSLGKVTLRALERGRRGVPHTVRGTVRAEGREVPFVGLVDTGHLLRDPLGNVPVFLADTAVLLRLFPELGSFPHAEEVLDQLVGGRIPRDFPEPLVRRFRLLPYRSVGGSGLLPAFVVDEVVLEADRERIRLHHPRLAWSVHPLFADAAAEVLVPAQVFPSTELSSDPRRRREGHVEVAEPRA
ncbi:MAG: Sporulation sigma-E factor processing peptidase (SpoIIGA) [Brockia lithotrophica]|uniref:Sporulation sigma-E factor processing peptidase (SpoIIGA) n=1 Tax=Brockia lithotrophica TaxID=933949 RepID=A0A2T5G8D3_9BACL|nr:sigma-E processing peptidase SpoIIGA [Brockia lithotrophica]PTQ52454.1 MAG: Sporulation sigma-E factor processing peptidase (SpoIIGA) [Brockia lithotrophica]